MIDSMALLFGMALVAVVAAFAAGRFLRAARPGASTTGDEISAVGFARLQERERLLGEQIGRFESQTRKLAAELECETAAHREVRERAAASGAAAVERERALQQTIAERDEQLKGTQERLKTEFENMANRVLAATANQLSTQSQESLAVILNPLKERIAEFQQKVEASHLEDTSQRATIVEQIRQVTATGQSLGMQAENLTKALKGDPQLRGQWAEIRLERILEQAGLERGRDFVVQGGDFNLKGEDGGSVRPDVIVLLPENRHLIIDSKLSLIHYLEYEAAEDEEARAVALKKLVASVRGHADSLAAKRYQSADGLNAHELVLMFIPIEGVAAAVLRKDDGLYSYCWNKKIVMVAPSALLMTMTSVASIWRDKRQNESALRIAHQAGQLYDKLAGFVCDLNEVSLKIQSAADAHGEAMKKLATGKGNALSRAQKLKALDVSSKKDFPFVILGGEKHAVDAEEDEQPGAYPENGAPKLLEKPAEF